MKKYKVNGIKHQKGSIQLTPFDVFISNDDIGISLSVLNQKDDCMYQIPITKSMLKELIK